MIDESGPSEVQVTHVNIGRAVLGSTPEILEANLGSCLGIGMVWPHRKRFALAHCLLPSREANPTDMRLSRYAATAPQFLLQRLKVPRDRWREVRAVIAGGANMFTGGGQSHQVGEKNVAEGLKALRELGVRIVGQSVGGSVARRLRIDCQSEKAFAFLLNEDSAPITVEWRLIL